MLKHRPHYGCGMLVPPTYIADMAASRAERRPGVTSMAEDADPRSDMGNTDELR
jgi:hypothetical protein